MARYMRCRLRKWFAVVFVLFSFSVCVTYLVLLSYDDYDDFYVEIDGNFVPQFQFQLHADYGGNIVAKDGKDQHDRDHVNVTNMSIPFPILLWWTPFTGERGKVKTCGNSKCFFTVDRHFKDHPKTQVFLFYGTDFKPLDLPLPRQKHQEWALFHEESPKNNYILSHEACLTLFNHTSTFKRESDFPITMQHLESLSDLRSLKYLVPTKKKSVGGLAPVVYIQTDCDPPSDRDSYVKELMKYIPVDSYGKCLHNKDLPANLVDTLTMDHKDLYRILAQYKFTLAFENAICDDYITEKLWRPLMLGSVPVYRGSPKIRDWLPNNQSAIIADDFKSPKELAAYLKDLATSKKAYEQFLTFKKDGITNQKLLNTMTDREWGVNDDDRPNFIDAFECFVCQRIHENRQRAAVGLPLKTFRAAKSHYDCPRPRTYNDQSRGGPMNLYHQMFDHHTRKAKALRRIVESGQEFSVTQFNDLVTWYKKNT